ncbi:hypothetical protein B0H17DRAFT_854816, partial [Mycena rosella]
LLVGNDTQAQDFRSHITQYSVALAFTSLGMSDEKHINCYGPNAWVFRILGNLRHLSGTLTAPDGVPPSYVQLYMYDPSVALQQRMKQDTIHALQILIHTAIYKQAYDILEEMGGNDVEVTEVRLQVMLGRDRRQYNLLSAEEVAFILPRDGSTGESLHHPSRCNRLPDDALIRRISDNHPTYARLYYVYVLLFPR